MTSDPQSCSWCRSTVGAEEGYLVGWPDRGLVACFCRLEHLVPWGIKGFDWREGASEAPADLEPVCARCGAPLGPEAIHLVRRRGGHRISDGFCSEEHLLAWAKAGGRWA